MSTAPAPVRTNPLLRACGTAMDAYRRIFVTGRVAPLLSRPQPVRHSGFELDLTIDAITDEADDVVSLTLRPTTGAPLPQWSPGAHLDLFLPSGRQRQYSLCGDPNDRNGYRIAVRRIADGGGGSIEVHEQLQPGQALRAHGPRNAFRLFDAPAYLFIAGGIGITPILPMAHAVGARGRLVYTGRDRASMPFLDKLPDTAQVRPDDEFGAPDLAELIAAAPAGAAVYVCGPAPMLDAADRCMAEANPAGSLHMERFSAPPVVGGTAFDLTLARSGKTIRVGAEETTLSAIRRELPLVAYSCQQGFCRTCRVTVLDGEADHRDRCLTDAERRDQLCPCVSRSAGGPLVIDL